MAALAGRMEKMHQSMEKLHSRIEDMQKSRFSGYKKIEAMWDADPRLMESRKIACGICW